jgi:hypothetical protein
MPKDAAVVDSWHDHQIFDGTDACLCKVDQELTKEDFRQNDLHLNQAETDVKMRFQHLMNWGFASVLREAFDSKFYFDLLSKKSL